MMARGFACEAAMSMGHNSAAAFFADLGRSPEFVRRAVLFAAKAQDIAYNKHGKLTSLKKLLAILANLETLDDEGDRGKHKSAAHLAELCSANASSISTALPELRALGAVDYTPGGGKKRANTFRLAMTAEQYKARVADIESDWKKRREALESEGMEARAERLSAIGSNQDVVKIGEGNTIHSVASGESNADTVASGESKTLDSGYTVASGESVKKESLNLDSTLNGDVALSRARGAPTQEPLDLLDVLEPESPTPAAPPKPAATRKRPRLPEIPCPWVRDDQPDLDAMFAVKSVTEIADKRGMSDATMRAQAEKFIRWHHGKDSRWSRWTQTWATWCDRWDGRQATAAPDPKGRRFVLSCDGSRIYLDD